MRNVSACRNGRALLVRHSSFVPSLFFALMAKGTVVGVWVVSAAGGFEFWLAGLEVGKVVIG